MDTNDIDRQKLIRKKEMMLRGEICRSSALIEFTVARIMLVSNFKNPNEEEMIRLKQVTINEKLDKAHELIKKFHPDRLKQWSAIFEKYKILKRFRNQIVHCFYVWDIPNLSEFFLWDAEEDKVDKLHYFRPVRLTMAECIKKIKEFRAISYEFLQFVEDLEMDLGRPFQVFLGR